MQFFDTSSKVTAYLQSNLDSYNRYGFSINYNLTITNYWSMQHGLSGYFNNSRITYFNKKYHKQIFNLVLNGIHVFSLPYKTSMSLSYNYYSPGGDALNGVRSFYWLDMALQKPFFTNRLNVRLNLYDVFYLYKYRGYFRETGLIDYRYYSRNGSRSLGIQLTYNFGKSTYKAKQTRNSSAEEESRTGK